ncbi:MAG: alanine--glyoxylate aminotransferase family protein [bacterium]|nr:MAG: alanine--glyoxylate aminotransferase family protein [bacterium]
MRNFVKYFLTRKDQLMSLNSYKKLLLTAGPAPISLAVQKILSQPMIYHRSDEFVQIFKRLTANLQSLFQTEHEIFILTASGTGGMEAIIANLFSPGDSVLVVENGKFSQRWSQIAEIYSLDVKRVKIPWGKSIAVDEITEAIRTTSSVKAVFLTHCETSTGALTDLETIVPQIRKLTEALIIVDVISSAAVLPLKMDQWQIDVVVTASQKGLGLPPGLTIVALNKHVWRYIEQAELPRYYFDLTRARQALRLDRGSTYTPAIPLILAADFVLQKMRQIGLENIWQQRKQIASNFREKIVTSGLTIFPELPADSLTVIKMDNNRGANHIITLLRDKYRIVVSKGQGRLSDKVIRVGHFVNVENEQLDQFLRALKAILYNSK